MANFNYSNLPISINTQQQQILNKKFNHETKLMPHELSGPLGISYSDSLSILITISLFNLCSLYLIVYHLCENDLPVASIPFKEGFPDLPWICDNCEEEINDINELSFGIMAVTQEAINFIS